MSEVNILELGAGRGNYRTLFEQSLIPIALISVRGGTHVVTASRGFLATFDLRRAAVAGRPLDGMFVTDGDDSLETAIHRCLATAETFRIDVELRGQTSRRFIGLVVQPAHTRGFPDHVVLETVGRGHSVHALSQRLSSLFDQAGGRGGTMTYVHDLRRHRLRYLDGALARRLGFPGESMLFEDFIARVHPDDRLEHPAYEVTRAGLGDEDFATQTVRVRDRDGEWRLVNLRTRVLRRGRDGAVRILLGIAADITDYAAAAVEAAGISVAHAEQNERARIGRELHDSTSQHLVAADLGLSRVLRSGQLSPDDQVRLRGVQESLALAQTEIRAFSYFLHPPELQDYGLLRALEKFCAGFARRSDIDISFVARTGPVQLSSEAEHALFRVCQEALMNVYRHAFAQRVSVTLELVDGQFVLEVRDDGIGLRSLDQIENGGIGVAGMRVRMNSVGGELALDYRSPGLSVIARVPQPPVAATGEAGPAGLSGPRERPMLAPRRPCPTRKRRSPTPHDGPRPGDRPN
jgi:PAS domain S-box-containing protein